MTRSVFVVEALQAGEGDSLIVHFGSANDPKLIVIDGGPGEGVDGQPITNTLIKRLRELQGGRESLPLEAIVATHIDNDHIVGLVELCDAILQSAPDAPRLDVATLWHNTFEDLPPAPDAGLVEGAPDVVIEGVPDALDLRTRAIELDWPHNAPFDGAVRRDGPHAKLDFGPLELTMIGPDADLLELLRQEWAAQEVLFDNETSKTNRSSIAFLLEIDNRKALMTGDAFDRDLLEGLEAAGAIEPDGVLPLALLKLPHHGSDRNAHPEFFRRLPADNYVVSADGRHDNPDLQTMQWLLDSRTDNDFTIHMTNRTMRSTKGAASVDFLLTGQERRGFGLEWRDERALSMTVDLAG